MRIIYFFLLTVTLSTCELPSRTKSQQFNSSLAADTISQIQNEEYVMVTTAVTMPMYVNHDQAAFKKWGEKWA